ncbi:DUF2589 domain-containing protein [Intestinibacillus massiliensis]|uniref:DUF2589 domain-containing protein n=1 Tax=Intestinibacillus massiliensis TaxID=1871029 RepID=UPI000B3610B2|nr:DUF2589 domain-containing protein [Intestinibacillus massiliensis]
MQLGLGELIAAIGQDVSEAQKAVEARGIQNYLSYFRTADAPDAASAEHHPQTATVLIPSPDGTRQNLVEVPLVTMAHHNTVELENVRIKLHASLASAEDGRMLVDVNAPEPDGLPGVLTEMELCFRCGDPTEGVARVNTELNKFL